MPPADLFLVRHGETEWSRSGRHTGNTDLPLLPDGVRRAELLRERLSGESFAAVYCSPLRRARETARLSGFHGPDIEPLLREWDYGDYEGVTTMEIQAARPGWDLWRDGCPGGESPATVLARAGAFLERAFAGATPAIAFSHGHFIRALAVCFAALPAEAGERLSLDTAAVSVLRQTERGPVVQLWNSLEHLPGDLRR